MSGVYHGNNGLEGEGKVSKGTGKECVLLLSSRVATCSQVSASKELKLDPTLEFRGFA